jgi:hypothetical protein
MGFLSVPVFELGVVAFVVDIQHDGTWTEVEGNVLADFRARVTADLEFLEPAKFDFGHTNGLGRTVLAGDGGVRQEATGGEDLCKIRLMRDVVDLRMGRGLAHAGSSARASSSAKS